MNAYELTSWHFNNFPPLLCK